MRSNIIQEKIRVELVQKVVFSHFSDCSIKLNNYILNNVHNEQRYTIWLLIMEYFWTKSMDDGSKERQQEALKDLPGPVFHTQL